MGDLSAGRALRFAMKEPQLELAYIKTNGQFIHSSGESAL